MLSSSRIKSLAAAAGFDRCGIAAARPLEAASARFERWLAQGCDGGLEYLRRNREKRFDPALLVDGARTVVVCAVGYRNALSGGYDAQARGKVASYACAADYHVTLRTMLQGMLEALRRAHPGLAGRAFVDSAPLAEKVWAVEAGLGWIGHHSLLVVPGLGSQVLLSELVLNDRADRYDSPLGGHPCGACRRCMEACPNGALVDRGVLDAGRCIARLTIEREGDAASAPAGLHGWIFGCDLCQQACPHNAAAPFYRLEAMRPLFDPRSLTPARWRAMSPADFEALLGATPLARAGLERLLRNLQRP